jgi:hypothetical protein
MIGVDTNILICAHRTDSPWHQQARRQIRELAEGEAAWAIAWPAIHEFVAIVTHPRIFQPPTPLAGALRQVEIWLESPSLRVLGEASGYWTELKAALTAGKVAGGMVHDAHIAAICRQHGVRTLLSADRDLTRFGGLRVVNPLL